MEVCFGCIVRLGTPTAAGSPLWDNTFGGCVACSLVCFPHICRVLFMCMWKQICWLRAAVVYYFITWTSWLLDILHGETRAKEKNTPRQYVQIIWGEITLAVNWRACNQSFAPSNWFTRTHSTNICGSAPLNSISFDFRWISVKVKGSSSFSVQLMNIDLGQ